MFKYKKSIILVIAVAVISAVAVGLILNQRDKAGYQNTNAGTGSIVYDNIKYGFRFSLPQSWKGYTIVKSEWDGMDSQTGKTIDLGSIISIRHPLWTAQNPRQDIPIMIFTLAQWNALQQGKFHIGAAPIGPSELGRNSKYVFALPARYNYAFPTGYQEVETILKGKPLKPTTIG